MSAAAEHLGQSGADTMPISAPGESQSTFLS